MSLIKANELRIGNLVQDGRGNLCKVKEINEDEFYAPVIRGALTEMPNHPIVIKSEWLERAGFKDNELSFRDIVFTYRHGSIYVCLGSDGVCKTEVYYIHQLQNLYFALTGEELTFKP